MSKLRNLEYPAIEPIFDQVGDFHSGRAEVVFDGYSGVIDVRGEFVVPAEFWRAIPFGQDAALVMLPEDTRRPRRRLDQSFLFEKFHLFNNDIGIVTESPVKFDWFGRPGDIGPTDRIWASLDGSIFGLMDDAGNWLTEPSYAHVQTLHEDRAIVARAGASGERHVQERLDYISFGILRDGGINGGSISRREVDCSEPIVVGLGLSSEREWTFVRTDGKPLTPERWFTKTHRFNAGYAIVQTGSDVDGSEMWGILNELGEFTLPLAPTQISRRSEMLLPNGQPYFLFGTGSAQYPSDAYGQPVKLPDAIDDNRREQAIKCSADARIVGSDNGFGIEGPDGATLVPSIHRAISCYQNGVAWAPNEDSNQWCPIGPDGAFRSEPACIENYYPYSVTHHYAERFSDDLFESNILWVRAWLDWGMGLRDEPPIWVGDGVMSQVSHSVAPFRSP